MKNKKFIIDAAICLGVCVIILNIRHAFIYPSMVVNVAKAIFEDVAGVIIAFKLTEQLEALMQIPPVILMGSFGIVMAFLGYGVLKTFHKSVKFSYLVIHDEFSAVVKKGLIIYIARAALMAVFAYSVIGIPIAALIFALTFIFEVLGMVPVAVNLGSTVQDIFNGSDRRMSYHYIIGIITILFCINVYAFGCTFFVFIFPVLSLGTVYCSFEKKFFRQQVYAIELDERKDKFDRRKIRNIITKGLK